MDRKSYSNLTRSHDRRQQYPANTTIDTKTDLKTPTRANLIQRCAEKNALFCRSGNCHDRHTELNKNTAGPAWPQPFSMSKSSSSASAAAAGGSAAGGAAAAAAAGKEQLDLLEEDDDFEEFPQDSTCLCLVFFSSHFLLFHAVLFLRVGGVFTPSF